MTIELWLHTHIQNRLVWKPLTLIEFNIVNRVNEGVRQGLSTVQVPNGDLVAQTIISTVKLSASSKLSKEQAGVWGPGHPQNTKGRGTNHVTWLHPIHACS